MQRRDWVILTKIVDEINIAAEMTAGVEFSDFNSSETLKRALCITAINIGELVKGLSTEFRLKYSHIPWKSIAGFHDIAAHKYQSLRMTDVYNAVILDFPELKKNIEEVLKSEQ